MKIKQVATAGISGVAVVGIVLGGWAVSSAIATGRTASIPKAIIIATAPAVLDAPTIAQDSAATDQTVTAQQAAAAKAATEAAAAQAAAAQAATNAAKQQKHSAATTNYPSFPGAPGVWTGVPFPKGTHIPVGIISDPNNAQNGQLAPMWDSSSYCADHSASGPGSDPICD